MHVSEEDDDESDLRGRRSKDTFGRETNKGLGAWTGSSTMVFGSSYSWKTRWLGGHSPNLRRSFAILSRFRRRISAIGGVGGTDICDESDVRLKRAGLRAHLYGDEWIRPSLRLRFLARVGVVRSVFIDEDDCVDANVISGYPVSGDVGVKGLSRSSSGDAASPLGDGRNVSGGVCAFWF